MATPTDSPFSNLPTELIHYILTFLEPIVIVRTFRCVCKRFYGVVKSYDRFRLNLKSIEKGDFHFLCNFIRADQIESLVLSDDDETPGQIEYFLSLFRIDRFTHLHTLTLIEIDDCHLNKFLKDVAKLSIRKLSARGRADALAAYNTQTEQLTGVLAIPTLYDLELRVPQLNLQMIDWTPKCRIQQLSIFCSNIDEYCSLLVFLPHLRVLTIEGFDQQLNINEMKKSLADFVPACQLTSLTVKYSRMEMALLGLLLPLTPTLEHLQLIRAVELHNFITNLAGWEEFVEWKMPLLTKFDLFLVQMNFFQGFGEQVLLDPTTFIEQFRTPFWLEKKRWFVTCDHILASSAIVLYSPSMVDPEFQYTYQSKQIRRYVSIPGAPPNDRVIMPGVRKLHVNLEMVMASAAVGRAGLPTTHIFPHLETLSLPSSYQWHTSSLRFLSALIDLSRVKKLSLESISYTYASHLHTLIKHMPNLRSIHISGRHLYYHYETSDYLREFCSSLTDQVKHLSLLINNPSDMFRLRESIRHRSSVKFHFVNYDASSADMQIEWLNAETGYYTCRLGQSSLCLWLDKVKKDQ